MYLNTQLQDFRPAWERDKMYDSPQCPCVPHSSSKCDECML